MNDLKDIINPALIDQAMNYDQYMQLMEKLVDENKTTGKNQGLDMIEYTKMNLRRMRRLNKTITVNDTLKKQLDKSSDNQMIWLVLTEAWCGDAAQNIPLLNKVSELSKEIELKLILRDENLTVMDQFLTDGGRSIPKLIALNASNLTVLGSWGPRPEEAQNMVVNFKNIPRGNYQDFVKEIQLWYAKDKTNSMQKELVSCLENWRNANNK